MMVSIAHNAGAAALLPAIELPQKLQDVIGAFAKHRWADFGWSLLTVLVAVLIGRAVAAAGFRAFERWSQRTETVIDDSIAANLKSPLRWLMPLLALYAATPLLILPEGILGSLRHALLIGALIGLGWSLSRATRVVEFLVQQRASSAGKDDLQARALLTQSRGLGNIVNFVIFLVTLGSVLVTFESVRQLGTTLLASAGVAGVILGLAAQRSLATVLAGLQIALTQPIRVGDVVIVEGEWGNIEEIALTYVVVKIWDRRRLVVPITYFIDHAFQNWTRTSADLLGAVELHVDYSVPVDAIRDEFKRILHASPLWDGEVCSVQITETSARDMVVRPLFSARNSGDQWNLRCEVREQLVAFLQRQYPHALPKIRGEIAGAPLPARPPAPSKP
jgi:small-conductance mechanosensitive channel